MCIYILVAVKHGNTNTAINTKQTHLQQTQNTKQTHSANTLKNMQNCLQSKFRAIQQPQTQV